MKKGRKYRAILIEDDEILRNTLIEILSYKGYDVFAFSNPTICPLQKSPECRCSNLQTCTDIIISDLDMPGMNGLTFIENQKEKDCKRNRSCAASANKITPRFYLKSINSCGFFQRFYLP